MHSAPEADSPSWWKYARSSGDIVDVHQHLSSLGSIGCQVSEGPAIASRKPWTLSRLKGLTLSCLFCFPLCCLFCLFYALFVITVATGSCLYSSEVSSCVLNGLQSLLASVLLLLALYLPPAFFSLSRWLLVRLFPAMIQFPPSASDCWASLSFHRNWYPLSLFSFCVSFLREFVELRIEHHQWLRVSFLVSA